MTRRVAGYGRGIDVFTTLEDGKTFYDFATAHGGYVLSNCHCAGVLSPTIEDASCRC